jgi:hypothetical protein
MKQPSAAKLIISVSKNYFLRLSPWTTSFLISIRTPSPSQTQRNGDQEPCLYTNLNHILLLLRLSLVAHSGLKHAATLRIISNSHLNLSKLPACCKTPYLGGPGILFRVSFPETGCLPWWKSPVYPHCKPGRGPLPGATHWASGTWSSH